jgi:hypothetical protein
VDSEYLDDLERYLREATILDAWAFPGGGGHPDKRTVLLSGGVSVVAKMGNSSQHQDMARREVAAWHIARALGWPELMGATVLRTVDELEDGMEASLQVVWLSCDEDPEISRFSDAEINRAAAFDSIVQTTDRMGHNWLGVPREGLRASRLKLVDHGYALNFPGQPESPQSTFFELRKGEDLADEIQNAIENLARNWPSEVAELIGSEAAGKAEERAKRLADHGVLAPN